MALIVNIPPIPSSGAPTTSTFITQTPDASLSAEQALSALATGILLSTTGTGVVSTAVAGSDIVVPDVAIATNKKLIIDSSTSLTSVAIQVASDPNTGIAAPGGADTISGVAGGAEIWRTSTTAFTLQSAKVLAIDSATSLVAVPLQISGDPDTGIGAPGGANTLSWIVGGTKWIETVSASGTTTYACHTTWGGGLNIAFSNTTGTKICTATIQKMGFWNATPVVQPTNGVNLTNNVTSGGTDDTIANYTDLTIYANDAAAIRNDIYQLAKKLKVVNDSLRTIGLNS